MAKVLRHDAREELRRAIEEHLRARDTTEGATLVREVALDEDAETSRVVAAMWTLVDDGTVEYQPGARLRLASR